MFACFNFQCRCQVLTGGISNHLFAYYTEGKFDDDVVIFRIEGEGNELMLDRKEERKHMQVLNQVCNRKCRESVRTMMHNFLRITWYRMHTNRKCSVKHNAICRRS